MISIKVSVAYSRIAKSRGYGREVVEITKDYGSV